jgi:nucleoside-diphosphate-sugar epimerase
MRVLVTGASGFLGRYVVTEAVRAGHQVRALVRAGSTVPGHWPAEVEVVRGDVVDAASLRTAVRDQDAVVHLAAMVGGGDADQFAVTVAGTERLLSSLEGSSVSRLVLASSFSCTTGARRGRPGRGHPVETAGGAGRVRRQQDLAGADRPGGGLRRPPWDLVVLRPGFIWGRKKPECRGSGRRSVRPWS